MVEVQLETLLEATLFAAGRSLTKEELAESLGYPEDEIQVAMESLMKTVKRRRGSALHIAEISGRWALEVKPSIADELPSDARTDLPQKLLKAAALIAYHQPMPQSRLVELLGPKAYDHVRDLAQAGLVDRRKNGNTRRLTTTIRFSEVFGCPHTDRKKVKEWFRTKVIESGMMEGMEDADALRPEQPGEQATLQLEDD